MSKKGLRVKVLNLNKHYKIDSVFVKRIVKEILQYLKKTRAADFEVIFLTDGAITRLNKRYRKRDAPTDVLSFKLDRKEFGASASLGEICISLDRAFENSQTFRSFFYEEVVLYLVHGILHFFGHEDEHGEDRREMSEKENRILCRLRKREDLSRVLTPR